MTTIYERVTVTLEHSKLRARLDPRMLVEEHRNQRISVALTSSHTTLK